MATGGGVTSREGLRYAEYLPPSAQRSDADIDHTAGRRLLAVGLGVAAVAFADLETSRTSNHGNSKEDFLSKLFILL